MSIVTARIPDSLNEVLIQVAKATERSKSFIVAKAIQNYVIEMQEDLEDYHDAKARLAQNEPTISLEEVIKNLGLKQNLPSLDQ